MEMMLDFVGKYTQKDIEKARKCNVMIGRGSQRSSTNRYRAAFGKHANPEEFSYMDYVFISAEGNRNGRLKPNFELLKKAIKAKVIFITDVPADRNRNYNIGEREVAEFLLENGYTEVEPGEWIDIGEYYSINEL